LLLLGVALAPAGCYSLFRPLAWRIPLRTLAVGVGGIFGYHFLYFRAFALAPAVEANLINYLWPLLIVVLSPLVLRGYRLRPRHIAGALLGLAGAALIVTNGRLSLNSAALPGYLCAAGAALTWALYSLLTRRLPPFPTESVGAFCAVGSLLAFALHALSRGSFAALAQWPPSDVFYLLLAGLGPMGAAFFFWDAAMKRGDPRVIGSLAYLTPLLSTLNLVLLAGQRLTALNVAAMFLIISGALIGSLRKDPAA
jgi:drug/metabolite transporter (DMT)-like permease